MASSTDIVLAGTKAFALALFAPLTERLGSRPRIAPEPQQALALCAGSSGLLVVEFAPPWLAALQQLRQQAPGLRILAALPVGQEAAALSLGSLGIEAIPWDGQPTAVLSALERLLGGAGASSPGPQPAASAPRPRVTTTPPSGMPAQPAPPKISPPVARPVALTPPGGMPARPVAPASPGGMPAPSAPRPPPVVIAPAAPAAAPLQRPAADEAGATDDLFSGLDEPAEGPPASAGGEQVGQPLPASAEQVAPPPYTGPPAGLAAPRAAAEWPATAPTEDEAESALVLYVRGKLRPDAPLSAVTRQAVAAMSELERQVLAGADLPFDARPVYRAAVLRLRVAAALASAPPAPAHVDAAAVQQLLGELDAMLAQVNPLAAAAPPEHQPSLEVVRNALVREAVDFSEAAHRITSAGPPPAQEGAHRPALRGPAASARVLSVQAGEERAEPEERRRRGPVIVLLVVLLLGAGYHLKNYITAVPPVPPPTFEGAPAGTRSVVTSAGQFLVAEAGRKIDPAELERFRRQEEKKGNVLRELVPGRWVIERMPADAKGARP